MAAAEGTLHLHLDALALDDTLAVLAVDALLALLEGVEGVELGSNAEGDTHGPEALGLLGEGLCGGRLAEADGVGKGEGIKGQVSGITELSADGGVAEDGVHGLGIGGNSGSLDVLNVLAEAHDLAGEAELLLDGIPGVDGGRGGVGAQQVPAVEAGKVLDQTQDLVAADGGGDEAQVVGYRGVVDESVGDHF